MFIFLNNATFLKKKHCIIKKNYDVLQNAKHRAYDASNDVNCPTLKMACSLVKYILFAQFLRFIQFNPALNETSSANDDKVGCRMLTRDPICLVSDLTDIARHRRTAPQQFDCNIHICHLLKFLDVLPIGDIFETHILIIESPAQPADYSP